MFVTIPPRINVTVPDERIERINRSQDEVKDMEFRFIHCPYCGIYLFDVFEDVQGHIAVKCNKCKGIVPINPAYFKRYAAMGRYKKRQRNLL